MVARCSSASRLLQKGNRPPAARETMAACVIPLCTYRNTPRYPPSLMALGGCTHVERHAADRACVPLRLPTVRTYGRVRLKEASIEEPAHVPESRTRGNQFWVDAPKV